MSLPNAQQKNNEQHRTAPPSVDPTVDPARWISIERLNLGLQTSQVQALVFVSLQEGSAFDKTSADEALKSYIIHHTAIIRYHMIYIYVCVCVQRENKTNCCT